MKSYAITTDGRAVAEVERLLRRYLPGLDVRLAQYSPLQAILPGHLLRALDAQYRPGHQLLGQLGVARVLPLADADVVALLRTRDVRDLARRSTRAIPTPMGLDWHLTTCTVDQAWQLLDGPDQIDWTGVRVGQIDTGYTTHPAYGFPATWVDTQNAATFVPDPPVDGPTLPPEEPGHGLDNLLGVNGGHGTKTGCTIAGSMASESFYGVAPRVPLVPVRICDFVVINDRQRQFEQAVSHLVDVGRVNVINVSLGLVPAIAIKAMKRAVDYAYEHGVIMVCAAGNYVGATVPPAALRRTLAVAGVTSADVPWSGSCYGPEVDLSAPAADVRRAETTGPGSYTYSRGGDGTSYATAIVSGAAALWLAHHRAALPGLYAQPWQVVEAFRHAARGTARKPANWRSGSFGEGILDTRALLDAPLADPALLSMEAANA